MYHHGKMAKKKRDNKKKENEKDSQKEPLDSGLGIGGMPEDGGFLDLRMLLIVLILSSIALNLVDLISSPDIISNENVGAGSILKSKDGDYYVMYNLTEKSWLGIEYPFIITSDMNYNDLGFLEYLIENKEKENISCVLSWWEHGHAIKGIANVTPFFKAPEPAFVPFTKDKRWDTSIKGDFSNREEFKSFAEIMHDGEIEELVEFADEINCIWIFVSKDDLYDLLSIDMYLTSRFSKSEEEIEAIIRNSLLYELNSMPSDAFNCKTNGLEIVYEDENSRLFRLC